MLAAAQRKLQSQTLARTRTVRLILEDLAPEAGVAVVAGDKPVGTMGSSAGGMGLGLLRIDRAADALDAGVPLTAGGIAIRLADLVRLR